MTKKIPSHIKDIVNYLKSPSEKANEDMALSYFRKVYGEQGFTRQTDAKRSDGYVPGHFVLELKGKTTEWFSGLLQGLAYRNQGLNFSLIIVAAEKFLSVWDISTLPQDIVEDIKSARGAPNSVGKKFAQKYSSRKNQILRLTIWDAGELIGDLFSHNESLIISKFKSFEQVVKAGKRVRQKITTKNFTQILNRMKQFFDPSQPIKTVRAFYSMLYGPWDENSTLILNQRNDKEATLGGSTITNLNPVKTEQFKDFIESHYIHIEEDENRDDFFSRYDEALDCVDKDFRIKNGIFFTDLDLSKFVMWFVKKHIPDLGKNYLVIDPACGSGNLVTNWRSPLELRHKVVSEIEPELLYAVEQRMKGDQWHNGKFTVVPRISENKGLNFLDKSASEYLSTLDKPIAFLCNPPYRSDDDQTADSITYDVDQSITEITGKDASSERYCCFLGQMKQICKSAADSGLPGESILLLFTKAAWLTKRPVFQQIRREILGSFEDVGGILVNGKEFFDVKGKFPVAFTVWKYRGEQGNLDAERPIPLVDLTWMSKKDLSCLQWGDIDELDKQCTAIFKNVKSAKIMIGMKMTGIKEWVNQPMVDFKRDRRKGKKDKSGKTKLRIGGENNIASDGGLPLNDPRRNNKKIYGENDGCLVGFMDDLTPCRIKKGILNAPWFHLDARFMRVRAIRCFSGPPDNRGYCAQDIESARRTFQWFALSRTFAHVGYPMWVDAEELWAPICDSVKKTSKLLDFAWAIGFAENECVETVFPANNPINSVPEIFVPNPMTPLNRDSFWSQVMAKQFSNKNDSTPFMLVATVNQLFITWKKIFKERKSITAQYERPYWVSRGVLTIGAGIVQIKDFANETQNVELLQAYGKMQELLKQTKEEFYEFLVSKDGFNYFGRSSESVNVEAVSQLFNPKTKFDHILEKRLALASVIVDELKKDKYFGRTKFAKLFYLADVGESLDLKAEYCREAAGPLDQRLLYNPQIGIEALARRHDYFESENKNDIVRYKPRKNLSVMVSRAQEILGDHLDGIKKIIEHFRKLDTAQCEIAATLYACWNDLIIDDKNISDELIIKEFLKNWHERKTRFSTNRLIKALKWMRDEGLVPKGHGKLTSIKKIDAGE